MFSRAIRIIPIAAVLCVLPAQAAIALSCTADNGGITLPHGFCAVVVSPGVGRARHLAVSASGDIYVALSEQVDGGGIAALRDTNGDGQADVVKYFGDVEGTGIEIHAGYLYFGTNDSVVRYRLTPGALVPKTGPELVVSEFPEQNEHAAKSLAFDGAGHLYVNVGAPANACQRTERTRGSPGRDPCPLLERHGGIWQFSSNRLNQTQMANGHRYATGLRNGVAIAWNPLDHSLYVVQHGRDQLHQLWPQYYNEEQGAALPAEEFFQVSDGDNLGWPYCYYDWQRNEKLLNPEYGGDGTKTGRCGKYKSPIIGFPGHWAPDALLFYTGSRFPARYHGGAFIAFHGSWNRAPLPQAGYKVVFVPFKGARATARYEDFADGFAGAAEVQSPGDAKYRPVGLAQGPDGDLYIADSVKGRIWRVFPARAADSD